MCIVCTLILCIVIYLFSKYQFQTFRPHLHTSYNLRPNVDKSTIRHSANPDLGQCNLSGLKGYVTLTVIIRVIASGRFWGGLVVKDSRASGLSQNAILCIRLLKPV